MSDVLLMTAEEWSQMEDYELQDALQQLTGHMAVAMAKKRANAEGYHAYLRAKDEMADLKTTSTAIMSNLRSKAALA